MICNISCDQVSKSIVRQKLQYHEELQFMADHFTLAKVENTGAFLSIGHTLPEFGKTILLTILALFVLVFVFYLWQKKNLPNLTTAGICFIVGGGAGNIYDRIVHGSVTDFLHISVGPFQTGIFNMADVSIMTGSLMMVIGSYFFQDRQLDTNIGNQNK